MSYLHCPSCKRAYNLAVQATCPYCPVAATMVDPAEDIVAAAEALARAMARATPAERSAAAARMEHLALPAPGDTSAPHRAPVMRQLRDVLAPLPPPPAPPPSLVISIARSVLRFGAPSGRAYAPPDRASIATAIERRIAARMPKLLGDGLRRVRARVRALAA